MNKKLVLFIGGLLLINCFPTNAQTLQQAVAQTVHINPDILLKLKGWLASQKGIQRAQGEYLPTVDFNADIGTEHIDYLIYRNGHNLTPAGVGLSLRQMIFNGFATSYEVERNKKLTTAEKYAVEATANDTALLAIKAYLDVQSTQEIVNLAQKNYKTHQKIYSMIKHRSKKGLTRKADINQASGRLYKAKANLLAAQNNYADAVALYYKIVGSTPSNLTTPQSPNLADLPNNENALIQQAINNHPMLKATQADVEEARAQYGASKSTNLPHLDALLSATNGSDLNGYQGHYENYEAVLQLKYNLFHGGSDKAYQDETALLVEQAQQIHNHTYNQIVESAKLAWNALQASQNQLTYFEKHRNASILTTEAYYQQFKLGKRTLLDLLNSEDELFNTKIDYEIGQSNLLLSKFRILNANGSLLSYLKILAPTVILEKASSTFTIRPAMEIAQPVQPQVITNAEKITPSGYKVKSKYISPKISEGYTLQLFNSYNKEEAINFIINNNLQNKSAFYKTTYLKKDKYVVIFGAYKTPMDAINAVNSLPQVLQKLNPVAKSLAKVEEEMRS
jgi:adhesin transport system outer membrane protein